MTYTQNYNLDLYELGDNANLADGHNHNMEKIDTYLYQLFSMVTAANNSIATISAQVASLEQRVSALEAKA